MFCEDQNWRKFLFRQSQGDPYTVASGGFRRHSALCIA